MFKLFRVEMAHFMREASALVDDPEDLNNYAAPSLQLASTFRNRSKLFKTQISIENKFVRGFLANCKFTASPCCTKDVETISKLFRNTAPENLRDTENVSHAVHNNSPKVSNNLKANQFSPVEPRPLDIPSVDHLVVLENDRKPSEPRFGLVRPVPRYFFLLIEAF